MPVTIRKTWETVYFTASNKGNQQTIEATLNHENKTWKFNTANQEMVKFDEADDYADSDLKIEALKAAMKYVKEQFGKI